MKIIKFLSVVLVLTMILCACGDTSITAPSGDSDTQTIPTKPNDPNGQAPSGNTGGSAPKVNIPAFSDMFTDKDLNDEYLSDSIATVSLKGDTATSNSNAVSISGSSLIISRKGTYMLSGAFNGSVVIKAPIDEKVTLVLDGVEITSADSAAIYVYQADKVYVKLAPGTKNILENGGRYVSTDDNNVDAVIFSKSDLTINGEGTLEINATAGHGIVSKDDLVITGGNYIISAAIHGLSGNDSVRISDGKFDINCKMDAIHADNLLDPTLGFVYISNGEFNIAAEDDAIHASGAVSICGGNINIETCYEGIEGLSIEISGGNISIVAVDDGMNATDSSDETGVGGEDIFEVTEGAYIHISGGKLHINAACDGIDSNGHFYVSGGETYISGPTDSGNSALDYNGNAVVYGGIFTSSGSSGMAQNFGNSSTQGTMMVTVPTGGAGDTIKLLDANGNELISFTADKAYSSVIISIPEILQGESYTLMSGSNSTEITMTSLVYGSGGMGGFGGAPGGKPNGGRPDSSRPGSRPPMP